MDNLQQKHLDVIVDALKPVDRPLKATEQRDFETGAKRDHSENRGRYDLISSILLKRLAVHLEKGAQKYTARNWEKGIPLCRSFESLIRHAYQWQSGEQDEDHLAAVACNIMFLIHTEKRIQDGELPQSLLRDMPKVYLEAGYTNLGSKPTTMGPSECPNPVDYLSPETILYTDGKRDAGLGKLNTQPSNPHYTAGYNS